MERKTFIQCSITSSTRDVERYRYESQMNEYDVHYERVLYLSIVFSSCVAVLRDVSQHEIAKKSTNVEAHGATEAKLRVNAFGGALSNHDGSGMQVSMHQCLRVLTKPATQQIVRKQSPNTYGTFKGLSTYLDFKPAISCFAATSSCKAWTSESK